jgi:hypothetical protein
MELLETAAQSLEIENIIKNSYEYLIIVSPYLKISHRLKPELTEAFSRTDKVIFLFEENRSSESSWLNGFNKVQLLPIKNLNTSCYLNEETALITNMNLYDYSKSFNHELGVKLTAKNNSNEMKTLVNFIHNIIRTDHTNFNFENYKREEWRTMGDLNDELIFYFNFPQKPKVLDGAYIHICNLAKKLYNFNPDDISNSDNGFIINRNTIIDIKTYEMLRREIGEQGVIKKIV